MPMNVLGMRAGENASTNVVSTKAGENAYVNRSGTRAGENAHLISVIIILRRNLFKVRLARVRRDVVRKSVKKIGASYFK